MTSSAPLRERPARGGALPSGPPSQSPVSRRLPARFFLSFPSSASAKTSPLWRSAYRSGSRVYTGALMFGASVVALYAATPGASATALFAMLPAVIFLALGIIFDPTAFPIMGRTNTAVAFCVSSILFLSLPAMILTFVVMRKGAPTQPLFAGAVIGILSASLGAMIACVNDGTAFVATWYTAACAIIAFIGAVVGHRVLRW